MHLMFKAIERKVRKEARFVECKNQMLDALDAAEKRCPVAFSPLFKSWSAQARRMLDSPLSLDVLDRASILTLCAVQLVTAALTT